MEDKGGKETRLGGVNWKGETKLYRITRERRREMKK